MRNALRNLITLENEIEVLTDKYADLADDFCSQHCPLKIGYEP